MTKILAIFTKIVDVIFASGEERLKTAITNVLFIGIAVACAWGCYELAHVVSENAASAQNCSSTLAAETFGAIVGIIFCFSTGLYALISGIVTQAVLLIFALIGIIISKERGKNAIAFLIALATLAGAIVGYLFLIGVL